MKKLLFILVSVFSTNAFAGSLSNESISLDHLNQIEFPSMEFNLPEVESPALPVLLQKAKNDILKIETLEMGEGLVAEKGDIVSLHYKYTLDNGRVIDSSYTKGSSFELYLEDAKEMFQEMLNDKPVGTKSRLTISTNLANEKYKDSKLPPDSVVTVDLKIVDVIKVVNAESI